MIRFMLLLVWATLLASQALAQEPVWQWSQQQQQFERYYDPPASEQPFRWRYDLLIPRQPLERREQTPPWELQERFPITPTDYSVLGSPLEPNDLPFNILIPLSDLQTQPWGKRIVNHLQESPSELLDLEALDIDLSGPVNLYGLYRGNKLWGIFASNTDEVSLKHYVNLVAQGFQIVPIIAEIGEKIAVTFDLITLELLLKVCRMSPRPSEFQLAVSANTGWLVSLEGSASVTYDLNSVCPALSQPQT